ncbi:hypothetical protein [Candidatus Entotheonella palauensis]|uniref:hypothetical protein n=1 Tax=Candidatus Entotheonella palauensis TaxID=93172 RepID=UPI000B7E5694|nr:hypothetical protein [Candidatus Entotheonella palauensis]
MLPSMNVQPDCRAAALALMHPVKAGRADQLQEALRQLRHQDIVAMQGQRLMSAVQWVVFDNHTRLLCTIHFRGTVDVFLRDFATYEAATCRRIWGNCIGYPDGETHTIDNVAAYLAAGQVPITAYFPGGSCRSSSNAFAS